MFLEQKTLNQNNENYLLKPWDLSYRGTVKNVVCNADIWKNTKTGLSMNGVQLHAHVPSHTSIYLGMLSSHMQNFI